MAPQLVDDPDLVKDWVDEKQANEMSLAWDLLEVFNTTPSLRDPIRRMTQDAMDEMLYVQQVYPDVIVSLYDEELMGIPLLQEHPDLQQLAAIVHTLPVERCSNIIRLYGTVVEKAAEQHPGDPRYSVLNQMKGGYRKEFQAARDPGFFGPMPQIVWDKKIGGRQRVVDVTPHSDDAAAVRAAKIAAWEAEDRPIDSPDLSPVRDFILSMPGGIRKLRLKENDTIHKIDRTFGLTAGASISGTTTDTMFFVDLFAGQAFDPIYYLLAAAAIVAEGHHTMVEVAIPLVLNGFIDYSIGFYTTLMPWGDRGKAATMHPAADAVHQVLNLAEQNARNRLMLVYFDDNRGWYEGCYLFDRFDQSFQLLASADDNMLQTFFKFPTPWLTHAELFEWMQLYYP